MDGEEKVRILAWRQEKVVMKKICRCTKRARSSVMTLLAAARDLATPRCHSCYQTSIWTTTKDLQTPPNSLMMYEDKNYAGTITQMYRAPPEEGSEDTKSTCSLQNYPDSTYEEDVSPNCFEISSRKC